MTGENLLHQGRTGSRHPKDEYSIGQIGTLIFAMLKKFRRKLRDDPIDMMRDDGRVIIQSLAAQAVSCGIVAKGALWYVLVIKGFAKGKIEMKMVLVRKARCRQCSLHRPKVRIVKL